MKAVFMPWWRDLSVREQWLVALAAVLLTIVLVWMVLVRPLATARAQAEARHATAVSGLAEVTASGSRLRAAQSRGAGYRNLPLIELVGERAQAAGLTVENLSQVDGSQVLLRVAAVRPPALLQWIGDIEKTHGVVVERAAITPNKDATVAVELTLRRGGT